MEKHYQTALICERYHAKKEFFSYVACLLTRKYGGPFFPRFASVPVENVLPKSRTASFLENTAGKLSLSPAIAASIRASSWLWKYAFIGRSPENSFLASRR